MKEMKKYFINPQIKEALEKALTNTSLYFMGLDMGLSETSLRSFLKGKGLKESSYNKICKYLGIEKEGEKKMTDENFNKIMNKLEVFLHNLHLLSDTMQREVLVDCLKKAEKQIKDGKMVSFEKLLFEVGG